MTSKRLQIPIEKIESDFQLFLAPNYNRRIIFSGPFGIGKTYFLNKFFDNKKDEYFPLFLRPINYSLLSNEDVFKFIKYDILAQLIEQKRIDLNKEIETPATENIKSFLKNNKLLVLKNLLKIIPKIGGISDSIETVEELYLKYRETKESLSKELSPQQIKMFNEEFEDHFLSEFDNVSAIIKNTISQTGQKSVLIIDDLDRLDPEHIFRLFNVFSAHFDQVRYYEKSEENDNKFNFDKIIFVCDIENIRKVFAHKYGSEVDFNGYIDKFYSTEIYYFFHKNVFESVVFPFVDKQLRDRVRFSPSTNIFSIFLKTTMQLLFNGNEINIRLLERINTYIPSFTDDDNFVNYQQIDLTRYGAQENSIREKYPILIILKIYLDLFSSKEEVLRKFKNAVLKFNEVNNIDEYNYKVMLAQLILFADMDKHRFQISIDGKNSEFEYSQQNIKYSINGENLDSTFDEGDMLYYVKLINHTELKANGIFYSVLTDAVESIFEKGIIG